MIDTKDYLFYILTRPTKLKQNDSVTWGSGCMMAAREGLEPSGWCFYSTSEDLTGLCGEWVV